MTRAHARAERADIDEARRALAAFERRAALELVEPSPDRDPQTGRRTVRITGRPDPAPRVRRSVTANRISARPDRVAMWAVMLGLLLAAMAAATARADEPAAGAAPAAAHAGQL